MDRQPPDNARDTVTSPDPDVTRIGAQNIGDVSALKERYDVERELGRGGMGVVFRARDRETGDTVALKVLQPHIASDPLAIDRFKSELLLARKVTDTNVCRVHELIRFGPVVAIAMEYVEGETLRSLLRRVDGLSVRHGLKIARHICAGLAAAHARGVLHRDLKPENVMLTPDGGVKLMDFGIARSADRAHTTDRISGTPAYMAPEQGLGRGSDARSDIYSLGVILHEMFTGQRPAADSGPDPYLPSFLTGIVDKCLAKAPEKRFQSAAAVLEALDARTDAIAGPDGPPIPPHLLHARPSDAWWLGAAVLGIAGFLATADRSIPEASFKVRTSSAMRTEMATRDMVRRGLTEARLDYKAVSSNPSFEYVASLGNFAAALACLNTDCRPYFDGMTVVRANDPSTAGLANLDLDGSVRLLFVSPRVAPSGPGLPPPEALALAKRELLATFGANPDAMTPEPETPLQVEGRLGRSFSWRTPGPSGLTRHYRAVVFDRVTTLSAETRIPAEYRFPTPLYDRRALAVAFGTALLLMFFWKRVYLRISATEATLLSSLALIIGFLADLRSVPFDATVYAFTLINAGGPGLFLFAAMSPTLTMLALKRWPDVVASYARLVRLQPDRAATALALVRGCAIGVFLVGAWSMLIAAGIHFAVTWPRIPNHTGPLGSPFPALSLAATVVRSAVAVALYLLLVLTISKRWIHRVPVLIAIGAIAWLPFLSTISLEALPREWFSVVLIAVLAGGLSWVLLSYELLTLMVCLMTFNVFRSNYGFLGMFAPIGNGQFWMLFLAWGTMLGWAASVAFRPMWSRVGRRVADAF